MSLVLLDNKVLTYSYLLYSHTFVSNVSNTKAGKLIFPAAVSFSLYWQVFSANSVDQTKISAY